MIAAESLKVLSTRFANGKKHDFKLFKESKLFIPEDITAQGDTGYQGIQKIHIKSVTPRKRRRGRQLSGEDKKFNKEISSKRVFVEHAIGKIKIFKIVADKYRNRRKRFGLRFNLIAGIYNYQLEK